MDYNIIIIWFFVLLFVLEYYYMSQKRRYEIETQDNNSFFLSSAAQEECKQILMTDEQGNVFSKEINFIPPGTIIFSREPVAPPGWMPCNGSPYDKDKYPELHRALGSPPVPAVPDFQGFILAGAGTKYSKILFSEVTGGETTTALTTDHIVHEHSTKIEGGGVRDGPEDITTYSLKTSDGSLIDIYEGYWFWTLNYSARKRNNDNRLKTNQKPRTVIRLPGKGHKNGDILPAQIETKNKTGITGTDKRHNNVQKCFVGQFLIKL